MAGFLKRKIFATMIFALLMITLHAWGACNANIVITKPDSIYIDNADGTVTDKQTGLVWMQCAQGQSGTSCGTGSAASMNWKQALEAVQAANSGAGTFSYTDWRLPTVAELRTLVEQACYSPSINATLFPVTISSFYWSASPYAYSSSSAWGINFYDGRESALGKNGATIVRLVRGGQ